jgi:GNAT superfamily N-acetyltransferase
VKPASAADAAARALLANLRLLVGQLELSWIRSSGAATVAFTAVPVATLNGVWVDAANTTPEEIEAGLEMVTVNEVPYCIQARPGCASVAAVVAESRAMLTAPEIPLMATDGPVRGPEPRELAIRRLERTESRLHAELAGHAFGAPPELFATIITEDTLALPAVRAYVGEVGRRPVVTAITITLGDAVGVFNVATAPEHRRRGYGAAITARGVADARAAGALWSWLQSSDAGHGVYERLGFQTLERWSCWVGG